MSGLHVAVQVQDDAAGEEEVAAVERALALAAPQLGVADAELVVVLAGEALLRQLNASYRGQDAPTDVLSFAADPDASEPGAPRYLGDIVIAVPVAAAAAQAAGQDLAAELALLAVHGLLHLLGFDDETDAGAAEMTRREITLGVRRPEDLPEDLPLGES
jgi:probable rRNA maturation factor